MRTKLARMPSVALVADLRRSYSSNLPALYEWMKERQAARYKRQKQLAGIAAQKALRKKGL